MSIFVDTSAWYAAASRGDRHNERAKLLLATAAEPLVTSDHVLVESWRLIHHFLSARAAETFWEGLRAGVASIELTSRADLEAAWAIGRRFPDQDFSLVDRTSFSLMQRLGISKVITFDNDFAVFRYGRDLRRAFHVLR